MIFDTAKEDGVNMPELLQSVYISYQVVKFVVLNAKSLVPFNLLIFNFCVHEETCGYCYSQTCG
jgi:hypothetical protein